MKPLLRQWLEVNNAKFPEEGIIKHEKNQLNLFNSG